MRVNERNVWRVKYTHPSGAVSPGQSPARLVRYVSRRPLERVNPGPESTWESLPEGQMFGSAEAFKSEANRRTRERISEAEANGKDLSKNKARTVPAYLHIVLSPDPERSGGFGNADFEALLEPWTEGEENWFGAVHYDEPGRPHLHLMMARDKFRARDLEERQNRADEIAAERERLISLSADEGREEIPVEDLRDLGRDPGRDPGDGAGEAPEEGERQEEDDGGRDLRRREGGLDGYDGMDR